MSDTRKLEVSGDDGHGNVYVLKIEVVDDDAFKSRGKDVGAIAASNFLAHIAGIHNQTPYGTVAFTAGLFAGAGCTLVGSVQIRRVPHNKEEFIAAFDPVFP